MVQRQVPELEGLRRRDAVVLMAICAKPDDSPPLGWLAYTFVIRRWGVRGALKRLEARGLVKPGWRLGARRSSSIRPTATPEGRRVARAAAVMLELESFAGRWSRSERD